MNISLEDTSRLQELRADDYIWYIYIFIVFAALLSNNLERSYVYTKDKDEFTSYHIINIIVLTLAFFIYLYFLKISAVQYHKKRNFNNAIRLIGTIFLLLSGALVLIAELRESSGNESITLGF